MVVGVILFLVVSLKEDIPRGKVSILIEKSFGTFMENENCPFFLFPLLLFISRLTQLHPESVF